MDERKDYSGTDVEEKFEQAGQVERKTGTESAEPAWPHRVLEVTPLNRELPPVEEID